MFEFPTERVDESGRPYNPEMFAPVPDQTARAVERGDGEVTVEQRTWEGRMQLHVLESAGLHSPYLTPRTRLVAVAAAMSMFDIRQREFAVREGVDPAILDVHGEYGPFMEGPLGERVQAICDELSELLRSCPGCGRVHGTDSLDSIDAAAGYVEAGTGQAVKVAGADRQVVRVFRQVGEEEWSEEQLERADFERRFVSADAVEFIDENGGA